MTKTFVKVLTAAALISGAAVASQPASAMGFKNCTGHQVRVKIYNNRDTVRAVAKRNRTIGVNGYHWFKLDGKLYQVQVYQSKPGFDKKVLLVGGKNGGHKFSIRRSGSRYYVSDKNDCGSSAGKPPPGPVKTIAVYEGRWISDNVRFRIRQVTRNSFQLRQKGVPGWTTYTLVGKDVYRSPGGVTIVIRSRGVADFQGRRYTFKG
jgi:hypothetical protein